MAGGRKGLKKTPKKTKTKKDGGRGGGSLLAQVLGARSGLKKTPIQKLLDLRAPSPASDKEEESFGGNSPVKTFKKL